MQRESSIILNKVSLYIPVSHNHVGKMVQGKCWVLSGAEPSDPSEKGEFLISVVMVNLFAKCDESLAPFLPSAHDPWFLTDRPFLSGCQISLGLPAPKGISVDKPVPTECPGSFAHKYLLTAPTTWEQLSSSGRSSPRNFSRAHCDQQTLPVFEDHRRVSLPRK